jgi:UPF0716 family protein affecting phage T7 exclusion
MEILARTLDVAGKVLVAYTALRVHGRFRKEHKVDSKVFAEMKKESALGVAGIVFIITGYLIDLLSLLV